MAVVVPTLDTFIREKASIADYRQSDDTYSIEALRLLSYSHWPTTCHAYPSLLAKTGLYHTGL